MLMAPVLGQCSTQQPQNQHSSGYRRIGGRPFSELGIIMSVLHTFTQALHPLQISGLKITDLHGVNGLGTMIALSAIFLLL